MTATEAKYAQREKEVLAVTCAYERLSNFIIGKSITVETDHKPLVPLLTKQTMDKTVTTENTTIQDDIDEILHQRSPIRTGKGALHC